MPDNDLQHIGPTATVAAIYERLVDAYGIPEWRPDGDALGGLVGTILSQHTSDSNSERAFQRLIHRFPTWEAVRDAPEDAVEEAIRPGGLGHLKAARIQRVLHVITSRLGDAPLSLAGLADLSQEQAERYLNTLPGVGPKTAACVLLFSLGRPAFPVDTHVHRVCQRLGLIAPRASARAAHDVLADAIPEAWRHTMHVHLIRHGRHICHARRPQCGQCPLRSECAFYWQSVATPIKRSAPNRQAT